MQIVGAVHHSNKALPVNKRKRLGMEKGDYIKNLTRQTKAIWNNMSSYDRKSAEIVGEKQWSCSTAKVTRTKKKQIHLVYSISEELPPQDEHSSKLGKKVKVKKRDIDDGYDDNDLTQEPVPRARDGELLRNENYNLPSAN